MMDYQGDFQNMIGYNNDAEIFTMTQELMYTPNFANLSQWSQNNNCTYGNANYRNHNVLDKVSKRDSYDVKKEPVMKLSIYKVDPVSSDHELASIEYITPHGQIVILF